MGVACMNISASRHLKEEAWAIHKRLCVISNIMLFEIAIYTTKKLKNKTVLKLKQYYMHCYVTLSDVF